MKPTEQKHEYIRLRAEGKSYSAIAAQLHISKSTCSKWERSLADQIADQKREELSELLNSYGASKEARIIKLGGTLDKINEALDQADFTAVDPAKLMELKLKYMEALKNEYIGTAPAFTPDGVNAGSIVSALGDLLNRVRSGDLPAEQANKESSVLSQLIRAYDIVEIKDKMDELELMIGGQAS